MDNKHTYNDLIACYDKFLKTAGSAPKAMFIHKSTAVDWLKRIGAKEGSELTSIYGMKVFTSKVIPKDYIWIGSLEDATRMLVNTQ